MVDGSEEDNPRPRSAAARFASRVPKAFRSTAQRRRETEEKSCLLPPIDRLVCKSGHIVVVGKKDQDRVALGRAGKYYGVFDGHGVTARAADLCASELQEAVAAAGDLSPKDNKDGLPSEAALRAAFHAMDERVNAEAASTGVMRMGTCAIGVWLGGFKLDASGVPSCSVRCGWAGDCEAVLVGAGGAVTQLSTSHRPERADERARIVAANHPSRVKPSPELLNACASRGEVFRGGSFVARRRLKNGGEVGPECVFAHTGGVSLQISRSIGDPLGPRSVIATPEVTTTTIRGYGRLVLASDGLFDVITHEQVGAMAASVADPQSAARRLSLLAQRQRQLSGRSPDDIAIVVVDVFPSLRRIDGSSAQCAVM